MAYRLIGKDFTPPDLTAKVTGAAKYAEDFRADGMLFCKLLLSPMPHARVRNIDTSDALKLKGVVAVLTADELPPIGTVSDPMLTNEPMFVGQPILAVAAVDEATAAAAIDEIKLDLQPLPFVTDPLDSLYPGGPDARLEGNTIVRDSNRRPEVKSHKWSARDFAAAGDGQLPMGKPAEEWSYGDVEQGFADAAFTLDESFVTAGYAHHSMEPRSALAYWQNGKCYVYGSTQSSSFAVPFLARMIGIEPEQLVFVSEYCGGGFGSKGAAYPVMGIPAYLSKKAGRPVMLRISREEEYYLGSGRPGFQGRIKMGFRKDGRITAADLYVIHDNGPNQGSGDFRSAGGATSFVYQPLAMRWRGIAVLTNTPPKGPQRGPGQNQIAAALEPIIDKAARALGVDPLEIRRINAPDKDSKIGAQRTPVTSAYQREALDKGAKRFGWSERRKRSGLRRGHKVTGLGIGQAYHSAGASGFDGLVRIAPDGKLHIHTGVGNLGTYSFAATSRVAAEVLDCRWENCVIERGDTRRSLPWNLGQFGSNTSFTMTRTTYVAAMDAKRKLLEIAARDLGGEPEDYDLNDERVVAKGDAGKSLSFAQAARRAVELGGKYSGREMPDDINSMTQASVRAIAGTGLVGVSKDNLEKQGTVPALCTGFIEIELDTETGKFEILEYLGVADCGTVLHPASLEQQILGGAVMGLGMACLERHIFDTENGRPANRALYQCKPPSYLDLPREMHADAVDLPDPQNPVGAKGIGEPVMGAAAAALLCAISDALEGHLFNRTPVMPDMIVNALAKRPMSQKPLEVNS